MAAKLKPLKDLWALGLRTEPGLDTRGRHIRVKFEAPVQLNNAPTLFLFEPMQIGRYVNIRTGILKHIESIGRYSSIGPGVIIGEGEHPTNWLSTNSAQYFKDRLFWYPPDRDVVDARRVIRTDENSNCAKGQVLIGHDVWVGSGATVRRGVKLGHGCVVAANAYVNKDVPPYAIVGGLPARVLRYRFPEKTVERLLDLQWWRYELNDLAGVPFDDIDRAIDAIREREAAGTIAPAPYQFRGVNIYTKGYHSLTPGIEAEPFV